MGRYKVRTWTIIYILSEMTKLIIITKFVITEFDGVLNVIKNV